MIERRQRKENEAFPFALKLLPQSVFLNWVTCDVSQSTLLETKTNIWELNQSITDYNQHICLIRISVVPFSPHVLKIALQILLLLCFYSVPYRFLVVYICKLQYENSSHGTFRALWGRATKWDGEKICLRENSGENLGRHFLLSFYLGWDVQNGEMEIAVSFDALNVLRYSPVELHNLLPSSSIINSPLPPPKNTECKCNLICH